MAIGNVLLAVSPTYDYGTSTATQIFSAYWSLIGIPLCLLGLWGLYHKLESHVRIYLYYLIVSLIIDTCYMIDLFLMRDACVRLQLVSQLSSGKAFACGVARSINFGAFAVLTV